MTREWQSFGTHHLRVDGDLLVFKWIGEFTGADMRELVLVVDGVLAEHARIFMIVDARNASGADAEARKAAAQWSSYHLIAALAYIGASLTVRVLVRITLSARRLLGRGPSGPTHFVDTEEQARACIEAERRQIILD